MPNVCFLSAPRILIQRINWSKTKKCWMEEASASPFTASKNDWATSFQQKKFLKLTWKAALFDSQLAIYRLCSKSMPQLGGWGGGCTSKWRLDDSSTERHPIFAIYWSCVQLRTGSNNNVNTNQTNQRLMFSKLCILLVRRTTHVYILAFWRSEKTEFPNEPESHWEQINMNA